MLTLFHEPRSDGGQFAAKAVVEHPETIAALALRIEGDWWVAAGAVRTRPQLGPDDVYEPEDTDLRTWKISARIPAGRPRRVLLRMQRFPWKGTWPAHDLPLRQIARDFALGDRVRISDSVPGLAGGAEAVILETGIGSAGDWAVVEIAGENTPRLTTAIPYEHLTLC